MLVQKDVLIQGYDLHTLINLVRTTGVDSIKGSVDCHCAGLSADGFPPDGKLFFDDFPGP